MIVQRAQGYIVFNNERTGPFDAGYGVLVGQAADGGSGPPNNVTIFSRLGDIIQDRSMSNVNTRV